MQPLLAGGHPSATPWQAGSLPEPQQDVGETRYQNEEVFTPKHRLALLWLSPNEHFTALLLAHGATSPLGQGPAGEGAQWAPGGLWLGWARRSLGHQALPTRFSLPDEIATAQQKQPHFKDQQHLGKFWLLEAEGSIKGIIKMQKSERKRVIFDPTIKIYHCHEMPSFIRSLQNRDSIIFILFLL